MEFRGQIKETGLFHTTRAKYLSWMAIHTGLWFKMTITILGKSKDRKTREQLGYYWALLLPEIHDQYLREGFTVTVSVPKVKIKGVPLQIDRKPTMDDSHELNKDVCGLVGSNGERMDMRDMDKFEVMKYIDNVIYHATFNLSMDGKKLKAQRPT